MGLRYIVIGEMEVFTDCCVFLVHLAREVANQAFLPAQKISVKIRVYPWLFILPVNGYVFVFRERSHQI